MFMAQHSGVLPSLITGARGPERTFVDGAANDSSEPKTTNAALCIKVCYESCFYFNELRWMMRTLAAAK